MGRTLILGGTKGLGKALAVDALRRGITPIVAGRSAFAASKDPELAGAAFMSHDLSDVEDALKRDFADFLKDVDRVFWVAGSFLRKPLTDCTPDEIDAMTRLHFTGPATTLAVLHRLMKLARPLADAPGQPYHLVTVASTSSWRMRDDETVYAALKAAKAHFTRNFARELLRDLPGSKATLVHPGGMRTPNFWGGTGQDIGTFMDPAAVARIIWDRLLGQSQPYDEYAILRTADGTPLLDEQAHAPERPR